VISALCDDFSQREIVNGRNMLSAIVLVFPSAGQVPDAGAWRERTARSLSSLVGAAVNGLVGDAILVGPPALALESVADEAGCSLIEKGTAREGLAAALAAARRTYVLLLASGYAVERGFLEEAGDIFAYCEAPTARTLRAEPNSLATRLAPRLAEIAGVIAPRAQAAAVGAPDLETLARKLRAADLTCRARRIL
jgi:hypothetical protein